MPRGTLDIVITNPKDAKNIDKLTKHIPPKKLQRLYALMAESMPLPLACKKLGINLKVCKKLMRDIPQFREFLEEAEEVKLARVEHKVFKQAMNGHFASQHFLLTHTTDKFAPPAQKIQQEISGSTQVEHKGIVLKVVKRSGKKKKKVLDAEFSVKDAERLPEEP